MIRSYLYLSIFVFLIAQIWTYTVEDDGQWPWTHTKYITRSNWTTLVKANDKSSKIHHSIWFIFQYLTYCGFCKKAEPGWEAAAEYAAGWSRYIKIGAYDCAVESSSQNDICAAEGYPHWIIFCPLTNTTQVAFDSHRRSDATKPEDILMWSIKKINKIAPECYGKSWPIKPAIEPQSKEDLNRFIPKNIQKFQLFVSDDILQYSIYVLNNSKTVFKEPVYRLAENNPIFGNVSIWKGVKMDDGQISLEEISSTNAMRPFVLPKKSHAKPKENVEEKKLGSIRPTQSDIDSAIVWMVNKDLRRKLPTLFEPVKEWLNVLVKYYPGSDNIKTFLGDLINFMNNHTTISSKEFQNYVNSTSTIKLPELKFNHCTGSDPSKRGYTCALWVLFHSMTVKQAVMAENNELSSSIKPSDLLVSIREFVRKFFLCEECVQHFTNMTANAENEIDSFKESVLYLWRGHNKVNRRLRDEPGLNDPSWPKVPFPTKQQCNSCVRQVDENGDASEYDENETFKYLKDFYRIHQISSKKSLANKQKTNSHFLILPLILSLIFSL